MEWEDVDILTAVFCDYISVDHHSWFVIFFTPWYSIWQWKAPWETFDSLIGIIDKTEKK